MKKDFPSKKRIYKNQTLDSTNWDKVTLRNDDIIIASAPKVGTTWMQRIVGLLIHKDPERIDPSLMNAPWPENKVFESFSETLKKIESIKHRRFFKTHIPLDGLDYNSEVKYIHISRDTRDTFMSIINHWSLISEFLKKHNRSHPPLYEDQGDIHELWKEYTSKSVFEWEQDGWPYWSNNAYTSSFWKYRELPNILFVHYNDLLLDLKGQIKRIAQFLEIELHEEGLLDKITHRATFETMKKDGAKLLPKYEKVFRGGASSSNATHADWFKFTPTSNGTIDVESCNEGVDTRLLLHQGSCNSLVYQAMSDDDCTSAGSSNYASQLTGFTVIANQTYFIEWDNRWSSAPFDWLFTFTTTGGGLTITCPSAFVSVNNCSVTDYDPSAAGFPISNGSSPTFTYTDSYTSTTCTMSVDRDWIVTDASGSTATCTQLIDLDDTLEPTISNCPNNITVTSSANCQAIVSWVVPSASDHCSGTTMTSTYSPNSIFGLGSHEVQYDFTDQCNNTASCSFTITVIDGCNSGGSLDPCDGDNLTINGNIATDTYNAKFTIDSGGTVPSNANPIFKSGQEVNLNPGFTINAGATFEVLIEDCNN